MLFGLGRFAFAQSPVVPSEAPVAEPVRGRRGFELYITELIAFSQAGGINARLRETDYPELGSIQAFLGGGA